MPNRPVWEDIHLCTADALFAPLFYNGVKAGIFDEIARNTYYRHFSLAVLFVFPAQRHISISILTLLDTLLSKELDLLEGWAIDLRLVGFDIITKLLRCSRITLALCHSEVTSLPVAPPVSSSLLG